MLRSACSKSSHLFGDGSHLAFTEYSSRFGCNLSRGVLQVTVVDVASTGGAVPLLCGASASFASSGGGAARLADVGGEVACAPGGIAFCGGDAIKPGCTGCCIAADNGASPFGLIAWL
eukprot:CAMPEP_0169135648 /NCGR_PEP_ID=MMETSP1015-20121227/40558_1 /TAXON_ID=342587 /ORGANISM="Karlodinium micrum, Strain CCMP2283" /LENGTH=117 /DNA_ID=CAMNT_0009200321 /DNA_START=551 /DNA_END=904 /DNA_ORIENTATION=-